MSTTYYAHTRPTTTYRVAPLDSDPNRCMLEIRTGGNDLYVFIDKSDLRRLEAAIAAYWKAKAAQPVTAETTKDGGPLDGRD